MSRLIMFRGGSDAEDYKKAGKEAKKGLAMVMDAIENNDMRMAMEGAEKAWKGVKTMCEISDEMEQQYGERRYDSMGMRGYGNRYDGRYGNREHDEWNSRDDEWMERRMRDSRGRYM